MATTQPKQPTIAELWAEIEQQRGELAMLKTQAGAGHKRRIGRLRLPVLIMSLALALTLIIPAQYAHGAENPPPDPSVEANASGAAWKLGGNHNTNPDRNYLGTRDNQPVVFKTNRNEVMRLTPSGTVGIGTTSPAYKLDVNGDINGGTLRENGIPLDNKYALLDGSNITATWPISITGNAATVTGGLYTTGSYADPAWLTSLAGSKVSGPVASATNADHATTADSAATASHADSATSADHAGLADHAADAVNAANANHAGNADTAGSFSSSLAGDVAGGQNATTITKLQGVPITASAPTAGQVLTYNGSQWVASAPKTPAVNGVPGYEIVHYQYGLPGRQETTLDVGCPSGKSVLSAGYATYNTPDLIHDGIGTVVGLKGTFVRESRLLDAHTWRITAHARSIDDLIDIYMVCANVSP